MLQAVHSEEASLEENLDEEGTKDGWASLFEADTVIKNSSLSERLVGLILDVKKMTTIPTDIGDLEGVTAE